MKCGERIRALREDKDMTQTQMAAFIDVKQRTYSAYETGTIHISLEKLIKLAQFYDVDLNYISGISDIKQPYPKQ